MLKVFDTVHGLEAALLACGSLAKDLLVYLAVLAQLEAVLRLLTNNCCLAWLAGREATTLDLSLPRRSEPIACWAVSTPRASPIEPLDRQRRR